MANCLLLYFRSLREVWAGKNAGIVEPPMESIEKRQLRQMIREDFLQWAEAAFTGNSSGFLTGESKLNSILEQKKLFDEFMEQFPYARKYFTSTIFGKRMKHYCCYKGLHFNPNKPNEEGVDYFNFRKKNLVGIFDG